jgi:hypothetical protein
MTLYAKRGMLLLAAFLTMLLSGSPDEGIFGIFPVFAQLILSSEDDSYDLHLIPR